MSLEQTADLLLHDEVSVLAELAVHLAGQRAEQEGVQRDASVRVELAVAGAEELLLLSIGAFAVLE